MWMWMWMCMYFSYSRLHSQQFLTVQISKLNKSYKIIRNANKSSYLIRSIIKIL